MRTPQHDVKHLVTVIEGRALRSKDKWAGALSGLQTSLWSDRLEKCERA